MCILKFEKHGYMPLDSRVCIPGYRITNNYALYVYNTGAFKAPPHPYLNAGFTNKEEIVTLIWVNEKIRRLGGNLRSLSHQVSHQASRLGTVSGQ